MMTFFLVYFMWFCCAVEVASVKIYECKNFIDIINIIIYSVFGWMLVGIMIVLIFTEI